jgi:hypothetical protein
MGCAELRRWVRITIERQRDREYAHLEALCRRAVTPPDEAAAVQCFVRLLDRERANGVSLEDILGHLPQELSRAIRVELAQLLTKDRGPSDVVR